MILRKFVDALPIPSVVKPTSTRNNIPYYEITMKQVKQKLHKDLPPTTVWGYNGLYPGPTLEALRQKPIIVRWKNELPFEHLLPLDTTLRSAEPEHPPVRTVVHLHGGRVKPENDGYPDAWFGPFFESRGEKFVHKDYYYPNCQRPATLWYHDHANSITRLNVYAGLAGFYLLRDEEEKALNLPSGKYEIPLVIQDRSFYPNGELFYPAQPSNEPPPAPQPPPETDPDLPNPSVVPEFFGTTILVNGKVWPYLEVEPRKYRFRILNGSNARFYNMTLSSGQPFIQIGTDGGFLRQPVIVENLLLAPAERADVIIDFSKWNGQCIVLKNDAATPFPNGDPPVGGLTQIMQFRVKTKLSEPDNSCIPSILSCLQVLNSGEAIKVRQIVLSESEDEFGRLLLLINDMPFEEIPVTETPYNGTVEIWEFINTTEDTHPMHLHLVQFQILSRAPFEGEPGEPDFVIGEPVPPPPNERGWKDTVRTNPEEVTRIIARFGPFTGTYVYHCHILEHEDHDMMRPYTVLKNACFNPAASSLLECPDDSFAQCIEEDSVRKPPIKRGLFKKD